MAGSGPGEVWRLMCVCLFQHKITGAHHCTVQVDEGEGNYSTPTHRAEGLRALVRRVEFEFEINN